MSFISHAWSRLGSPRLLQLRTLLGPRTLPHLRILFRPPLQPRTFANTNFVEIEPDEKVEEETLPGYDPSEFYPVHIGEVFKDRYQVVAKLGFGRSSTVWLARDLRYFEPKLFNLFLPILTKNTASTVMLPSRFSYTTRKWKNAPETKLPCMSAWSSARRTIRVGELSGSC